MSSSVVGLSAIAGLLILGVTGSVIAAPPVIDQQIADPAGAIGLSWFDVVVPAAGIVVLTLALRLRWFRLPVPLARPEVFSPPVCVGLAFAMFLAGSLSLMVAHRVFGLPLTSDAEAPDLAFQAKQTAAAYSGQALIALAYVHALRRARVPRPDRRWPLERAAFIGVIALLLWWPVVVCAGGVGAVVTRLFTGVFPDTVAHVTLESMLATDSGASLWGMSALVVIGAPVLEELLYRGFIQEALRRAGIRPWPAVIATSLLFAVMHMTAVPGHALLALFVLSLGFGWAFERTGRLTASIMMHVVFNLGNLVLAMAAR